MGNQQLSERAIAFLKSRPKTLTPPTDDDSEDGKSMTEEPRLSDLRLNESIPVQQADTPTHKPRRRRSMAETQGSKDTAKPFDLTNHPLRHHQTYEQSSYQAVPSPLPIERPQKQQRRPEPSHKTFIPTILPYLPQNPFGSVSAPYPPPTIPLPPLPISSNSSPINPLHTLLTNLTTTKLVRSIHARLLLNPDTFGAQILTPLQTLYHPNTHQALHLLNTFPLHEGEKLRALSDRQKRLESQICLSQVLGFLEIMKTLPAVSQGTSFVVAKVEREVGDVLVRMCENDAQERSKEDIVAIQEYLKREMEMEGRKQEGADGTKMDRMEGGASSKGIAHEVGKEQKADASKSLSC
ncbi:hypothetical protein CB0940_04900 [Cercospora beticola]|uniref:Uncharacterized protein n=1 Tax=Cercospora beticola TaxID=122368 RepID=A0A2G5HLP8_CERBT|nr:hypothetical protein CB0940_04900 [Cercospora beticola]PIA93477.1 hypothetical protein CB0940_04900 [Cercospora beticola]WPB02184.1 hypothetical protein RHO25_006818 [Cercospora beticola]CAK1362957.1 unnamed protein product [Cercospora beticola]